MAGFTFKERGKKHSLNTCESQDSASGLLRTTISTICKLSPALGETQYFVLPRRNWRLRGIEGPSGQPPGLCHRVRIRTGFDPLSTLFLTVSRESSISCFWELEFSCHLSKAFWEHCFQGNIHMSARREKRAPGVMYWVFEEYINLLSSHFKVASHILSWLALNKPVFLFFFFLHRVD